MDKLAQKTEKAKRSINICEDWLRLVILYSPSRYERTTQERIVEPTDETEQKPKSKDQKDNEAFISNGREKVVDDVDEEEVLSEGEKLVKKKCDKELDNLLNLRRELEETEVEAEIAKVTLATQKSLFPL
ncbi:unnamed protein product [Lactuca saligna]|uniref:Uncharacterized protein n=1 Tax=Lactuca saligna TaxID=75948 RepID=A0AA35ZGV3_LACSI|nr:unnamed protein product [Lactuca saligna]